ncbi:MAG: amidohydrolase family protein [Clostridiales bacterium]|nr:amidohydrolase family protein [Clostridiales bacterium]
MIFANHAHLYPDELRENSGLDSLKQLMWDCGLDRVVAFATFPFIFKRLGSDRDNNSWLYHKIKNEDSIVPFGTLDFTKTDLIQQVDHIADLGFKGIKLHPAAQGFALLEERALEVYARAQEHDLFLSFHTGVHHSRLKDSQPILFDEIAYQFTDLRFSMEHIGGYSFFKEALAVMINNDRQGRQPRIFAGWTSIEDNNKTAWALTDEQLETVIAQTGELNSIFGLDFPFKDADYINRAIDRVKNLNISQEAKANILGGNLLRELS